MKSKDKIERDSYIWNTIAGIVNASEAVLLLAVVSRTNNLYDAGILTIAFAVANLMMSIGKFGVRIYQVTDVKEEFEFGDYLVSRMITTIFMILSSLVYVFYGISVIGYSLNKGSVVFCVCMLYAVETFEDVFCGLYQRKGRLDVASQVFSYRWITVLICFAGLLIATHNLLFSTLLSLTVSIVCCVFFLRKTYHATCGDFRLQFNMKKSKTLLCACLPLFLSTFLQFYLINSPKYAIDRYLTDDIQACYGFVAMPVFVIGLLNSIIYQPILVQMALLWNEHRYSEFVKRNIKQVCIIGVITVICLLGAYFFGVPVLSLLYNTNLEQYKAELMILLLGGGSLAVVGFFTVLLTIMRCQNKLLCGYITLSVISFFIVGRIVLLFGSIGAAWIYTLLISLLAIVFGVMIFSECRHSMAKNL